MIKYIILLGICACMLTGCLDANERMSREDASVTSAQKISDSRGPVKGLDPNLYYVSKYDARSGIYCGADPELHDLSVNTLQKFTTLQEAQEIFPQSTLFRSCDQLPDA